MPIKVKPSYKYNDLMNRAERVSNLVHKRMQRLTKDAGLEPSIMGVVVHNALVGYREGRPWRNVDYKLLRKVKYLERTRLFKAQELVSRYFDKFDPTDIDYS